jgi:thiol-disulfide isomerase/thioredoxin
LGQLRGKVVLLNFWATYCLPCRDEIPVLNAMQHELEARGLKIIGVSLEDSVSGIESYQKEVQKFDYQVLVGGGDAKAKFGIPVLPTTYLIDRDGRMRQPIFGARDRAGWEAAVKPLLDETPATAQKTN